MISLIDEELEEEEDVRRVVQPVERAQTEKGPVARPRSSHSSPGSQRGHSQLSTPRGHGSQGSLKAQVESTVSQPQVRSGRTSSEGHRSTRPPSSPRGKGNVWSFENKIFPSLLFLFQGFYFHLVQRMTGLVF